MKRLHIQFYTDVTIYTYSPRADKHTTVSDNTPSEIQRQQDLSQ